MEIKEILLQKDMKNEIANVKFVRNTTKRIEMVIHI